MIEAQGPCPRWSPDRDGGEVRPVASTLGQTQLHKPSYTMACVWRCME